MAQFRRNPLPVPKNEVCSVFIQLYFIHEPNKALLPFTCSVTNEIGFPWMLLKFSLNQTVQIYWSTRSCWRLCALVVIFTRSQQPAKEKPSRRRVRAHAMSTTASGGQPPLSQQCHCWWWSCYLPSTTSFVSSCLTKAHFSKVFFGHLIKLLEMSFPSPECKAISSPYEIAERYVPEIYGAQKWRLHHFAIPPPLIYKKKNCTFFSPSFFREIFFRHFIAQQIVSFFSFEGTQLYF